MFDALLLLPAACFVVRAMTDGERPGPLLQPAYGFAVASGETSAAGREAVDVTYTYPSMKYSARWPRV